MIDHPRKTTELMEKMEAALPIPARPTPFLVRALRAQSPETPVPEDGKVLSIMYAGDDGGIMCRYGDLPDAETKAVHMTSITYLDFGFRHPLSKEIRAYQLHRAKKIKRVGGTPGMISRT